MTADPDGGGFILWDDRPRRACAGVDQGVTKTRAARDALSTRTSSTNRPLVI